MFAALALFIVPVVAFAAAGFIDVDDDSVFVADIQWMKDNGITKGCNPPTNNKFCPKNSVTREQMSAFMHRLAISQVVDADKVDGKDAANLAPIAVAQVDESISGTTVAAPTTINSLSITVPTSGTLLITGSAFISVDETGLFAIEAYVGSVEIGEFATFDSYSVEDDDEDEADWLSYSTAAAVTAGTHTVSQRIGQIDNFTAELIPGSFFYNGNTLTVTFVPGGTVSASTASASDGGSLTGE